MKLRLLSSLIGFLAISGAQAAISFGVNFTTNTQDHVSGSPFGTSAWTNSFTAQGNSAPTAGSFATTETGVNVTYSASGYWSGGSWGTKAASNEGLSLFRGYLDDYDDVAVGASASLGSQTASDGIGIVIQLTNLAAWLASNNATSFNITLLLSTDTGSATFRSYTAFDGNLQGTNIGTATGIVGGNGKWDGTSSPGDNPQGTRGYATFNGLTADTLTIAGAKGISPARGTIAGFVVTAVPIPEPSALVLSVLGAGFLLRRRNRI